MEGSRKIQNTEGENVSSSYMWQMYLRRLQEHNMMLEDYQRQNVQAPETFFRPWEQPPTNHQANIAVVRPFLSNQNILSLPRVTSPRENLHKKILRGNHIQFQHRYQQQQQNHANSTSSNVNHDPESVILNRPLFLETVNNEQKPKKSDFFCKPPPSFSSQNTLLDPELDNSSDLIICEGNAKSEQCNESDDDEEIDCESVSSEGSSINGFQPLDLRTTKIPYSSTAEYEISVIRSLSPVPNNQSCSKESSKERKSRKLKTKRRICTACNRTYLKTKNLRWHFKSKLHLKRVIKLGIDDPANQPDTWYRTSEQHDNNTILLENITQDE